MRTSPAKSRHQPGTIRNLRVVLTILALAMALLAPIGAYASAAQQADAPRSLMASETILTGESGTEGASVEFVDGRRHFVFSCPDGYPTAAVSLDDMFADCEFLNAYFCLDLPPWHSTPLQPGCDERRRI